MGGGGSYSRTILHALQTHPQHTRSTHLQPLSVPVAAATTKHNGVRINGVIITVMMMFLAVVDSLPTLALGHAAYKVTNRGNDAHNDEDYGRNDDDAGRVEKQTRCGSKLEFRLERARQTLQKIGR